MGGGTYSLKAATVRSRSYASSTRQETFRQRSLDPEMDIKGKVRESCDSEEHPNSYPIIIALDMTGSMGNVPFELIKGGFPKLMGKIMGENIPDIQICFVGAGDDIYDEVPTTNSTRSGSPNCTSNRAAAVMTERRIPLHGTSLHVIPRLTVSRSVASRDVL